MRNYLAELLGFMLKMAHSEAVQLLVGSKA